MSDESFWVKQLSTFSGLYTLGALSKGGLLGSYYGNIIALFDATRGGLMFGSAATGSFALTAGVPIVTAVGVWVALGSGYYEARQKAKSEETMLGFSQGFVMAISGWQWNHVVSLFQRPFLRNNHFDEGLDVIRVNSYHEGLKTGYLAGITMPQDARKEYLSKIRKAGNVPGPKEWSRGYYAARNQQISYVIDLAVAARRYLIVKPE